jgi:hypothetical protein
VECPLGVLTALDCLEQLARMVVRVLAGNTVGFFLAHALDTLLGFEVKLDPEPFVVGIDKAVGMATIAVHIRDALWNAPL